MKPRDAKTILLDLKMALDFAIIHNEGAYVDVEPNSTNGGTAIDNAEWIVKLLNEIQYWEGKR